MNSKILNMLQLYGGIKMRKICKFCNLRVLQRLLTLCVFCSHFWTAMDWLHKFAFLHKYAKVIITLCVVASSRELALLFVFTQACNY